VTASNSNSSTVSVSQLAVSGPFGQASTCGASIPANGSRTWPAPFTAVPEGVAAAIEKARAAAGGKTVALAGPSIIQQALDLDLVDEIAVELAPVLLGKGIRFFGELAHAPVLLDDPEVTESTRVTHLRFRVRHQGA
jgi:dihydrofolate reductase